MKSLTTSNCLDPKVKEHVSWLWLLFLVENIYLVLEIFNCKHMSSAAPSILSTAESRYLMTLVIISRSSAYSYRICRALLYIVPVISMLAARIIISKQMLNRSHDRPSSYLNPFVVMNGSDFSPSTLTSDLVSAKANLHILTIFAGIPNTYIAERSLSLLMLSYACLKSIKRWFVSILNSCVFYRICLSEHLIDRRFFWTKTTLVGSNDAAHIWF